MLRLKLIIHAPNVLNDIGKLKKNYSKPMGINVSENFSVRVGDALAFQGEGLTSRVIACATDWPRCKISHIGIVADIDNNLAEATTLDGENGVAIVGIQYKLDTYKGHVWHLPLLPAARKVLQVKKMEDWIWSEVTHPYSKVQAVLAPLRVGQALHNWADDWYCSRLVTTALVAGEVLPITFNTAITPSAVTKLGCWGNMRQLK